MSASPLPLHAPPENVIERLSELVGAGAVLTSLEERRFHSLDFSEEPCEIAMVVVKPRTASRSRPSRASPMTRASRSTRAVARCRTPRAGHAT